MQSQLYGINYLIGDRGSDGILYLESWTFSPDSTEGDSTAPASTSASTSTSSSTSSSTLASTSFTKSPSSSLSSSPSTSSSASTSTRTSETSDSLRRDCSENIPMADCEDPYHPVIVGNYTVPVQLRISNYVTILNVLGDLILPRHAHIEFEIFDVAPRIVISRNLVTAGSLSLLVSRPGYYTILEFESMIGNLDISATLIASKRAQMMCDATISYAPRSLSVQVECFNDDDVVLDSSSKMDTVIVIIIIAVVVGVALLIGAPGMTFKLKFKLKLIVVMIVVLRSRRKKQSRNKIPMEEVDMMTILDRVTVGQKIGSGSFATVYAGKWEEASGTLIFKLNSS